MINWIASQGAFSASNSAPLPGALSSKTWCESAKVRAQVLVKYLGQASLSAAGRLWLDERITKAYRPIKEVTGKLM